MRIYIRSTNFELWLVIKNGEETPMNKVGEKLVPKTEDEFDVEDTKKVENYAKAINMLYCAVNPDDYRKISSCTTAREMWDKLEVTYESTDEVREAKIDFLTQGYEMFRMKEGEKIDDMFDRFSKIINDLHALKKTYANKDVVRKILRSLTPEWRSKADAIYESIGVSSVTIDGLRGKLKTYESTILTPSLDEQKKKGIALKTTKETVEEVSSDDDNEFGHVIKKFHKFMKKEFERKGRKHDSPPKCYGCGEIGHIKPRCPRGKNGKDKPGFKKQRAYISWGGDSDDESIDQEEDEAANLCLMAHEDHADEVQEGRFEVKKSGRGKKTKSSKKKSTAKASSSAPPPFPYLDGSFLEFGSEEELTRFLTHFVKRPISLPRMLPELFPQDKGYHDLDNQLKASGLWPFISKSRTSFNPAFVRAFNSNLHCDGDTIYSSINLYDIEIDLPTFARIAGLPIRGDQIATYGGDDWILNNEAVVIRELWITNLIRHSGVPTIHSAPAEKRLLLYILTRILRPRDGIHTSLFNEDMEAIHAIMHGTSINWAKFVIIHITDCASLYTERSLPYAFLVMDLIVSTDIHIAGPSTKMTKLWIIADNTFKKKSENLDDAGPSRALAPAPASALARASLQSIADTLNRLNLTVDGMGQYMERMDWTLQRQHHDMTAFFRGINYVPPPFDSNILGQNFEGKDEDDDSYAPKKKKQEIIHNFQILSSKRSSNFKEYPEGIVEKESTESNGLQFREETMEICPKYGRLSNCDENDKVSEFRCCFHSCSSLRFQPMISRRPGRRQPAWPPDRRRRRREKAPTARGSTGGLAGCSLTARLSTATRDSGDSREFFSGTGGLAGGRRSARWSVILSYKWPARIIPFPRLLQSVLPLFGAKIFTFYL
ncbi:unnamed protein product [Cuscuta campestris]|uniref:CCHC-type domain-containing protein n=1 Tax=Cuscuta campestris TaxID=132261 RepID=A0A484MNX8_9ASTE|nr:unnamed protein product [Cuscuta campestris]